VPGRFLRDLLILEHEIPKDDEDLGPPDVFVHLEEATATPEAFHGRKVVLGRL
jgi:hypothetical protein